MEIINKHYINVKNKSGKDVFLNSDKILTVEESNIEIESEGNDYKRIFITDITGDLYYIDNKTLNEILILLNDSN